MSLEDLAAHLAAPQQFHNAQHRQDTTTRTIFVHERGRKATMPRCDARGRIGPAPAPEQRASRRASASRRLGGADLVLQRLQVDAAVDRDELQREEAADEIMQFYKNYHSMRYVGRDLVLRIREPLPQESLDIVNRDFADVLNSGQFVQTDKLEEEEDDENTNGLTRLVAHFNRRNHGRLRQLINFINTQM